MKKTYVILLFIWSLIGTSTYLWFDIYPIKYYVVESRTQEEKEKLREERMKNFLNGSDIDSSFERETHIKIDKKPKQVTTFITIVGLLLILGVALIDRPKNLKQ